MNAETWKLIGLAFTAACFYVRLEFGMANLRKDSKRDLEDLRSDCKRDSERGLRERDNIAGIVRRNDTKEERRNKQVLSALIDTHAREPQNVKRFSSLLRDDSWSD